MNIPSGEYQPIGRKVDTLTTMYMENYYGGPLRVAAVSVAASSWRSMNDLTQKDGKERGIIISTAGGNNLLQSKILTGTALREEIQGSKKRQVPASFPWQEFPHGIKSLSPFVKDIVSIHTHPMHHHRVLKPTTIVSDGDIASFFHSKEHALVAVDTGGAHLLVRIRRRIFDKPPKDNVVENLIDEMVVKREGLTYLRRRLAQILKQYGLLYFYTPQLNADSNGVVTFQEPTVNGTL